MVLSQKQKTRLRTQGRHGKNKEVAALDLGINQGALNSSNTRIFVDFKEMLGVMNEYYPIFERRFRNTPDSLKLMKSLTRKIRQSNK